MTATEMIELVASIRQLAKAAPQGEWAATISEGTNKAVVTVDGQALFSTGNAYKKRSATECTIACLYVAALQPHTTLRLCDMIEELIASNQTLLTAIQQAQVEVASLAADADRILAAVPKRGEA